MITVRVALKGPCGDELSSETIKVEDESSDGIAAAVRRMASTSIICTGDTIAITEVDS